MVLQRLQEEVLYAEAKNLDGTGRAYDQVSGGEWCPVVVRVCRVITMNDNKDDKTNFDEDLKFSIDENIRRRNMSIVIREFPVKKYDDIEVNGKTPNDFIATHIDGTKQKIEFKNYRIGRNSNMLALEIYSDKKRNVRGWTFKTNADWIIFTWHGKYKECYLIVNGNMLREWWEHNYTRYEEKNNRISYKDGREWQSTFAWVPIADIPAGCIRQWARFVDLKDFWRVPYGNKNKT